MLSLGENEGNARDNELQRAVTVPEYQEELTLVVNDFHRPVRPSTSRGIHTRPAIPVPANGDATVT